MKLSKVTFGADIEFFISTRKGEPIPAIGMVGGSKEDPRPIGDGFFVQEDNVAVEFNIPISKTVDDFYHNVYIGFQRVVETLPPATQPLLKASCQFDRVYMMHPQAREFGCDPDINAYTKKVNPRPKCDDPFLRSAGGHVHIGWDKPDMETRFALIKACDVFCALPSVSEDKDNLRRKLYGKAGAMRIKPYGVEHRVLSNYWLTDPDYMQRVVFRYKKAVDFINYGHQVEPGDEELVQQAINEGSVKQAKQLLKKYENKLGQLV